jgi:hypothetical protein
MNVAGTIALVGWILMWVSICIFAFSFSWLAGVGVAGVSLFCGGLCGKAILEKGGHWEG